MTSAFLACVFAAQLASGSSPWEQIEPLFSPPPLLRQGFGTYRPLSTNQAQIRATWEAQMGSWPALLEKPRWEILSTTNRENFIQRRVRVEIAPDRLTEGWLLTPRGSGPYAAALVPYYEPESSIRLGKVELRDFGYQLTRRGFVTLSIGSPGGDARKPDTGGIPLQPLHFLGYVAANCANLLANLPEVDPARIGIVGHSYGGKWAMFAASFYDRFACGAWSDPGIVFDESRPNVNYWEPWYLGADSQTVRKPGVPSAENPRTGAYKRLYESGHDLTEVMALMAPRPFLLSGGSEDPPERWQALNRVNEVYRAFGATNRVAMSNRAGHDPTTESNEQIYLFFQHFLAAQPVTTAPKP